MSTNYKKITTWVGIWKLIYIRVGVGVHDSTPVLVIDHKIC